MSDIEAKMELAAMDAALHCDQSNDPVLRARARFLRTMALPMGKYLIGEIERAKGGQERVEFLINAGLFIGDLMAATTSGCFKKGREPNACARLALSVVIGMSKGAECEPEQILSAMVASINRNFPGVKL